MRALKITDLTIKQKIGQMLLCRRPINKEDKGFIIEMIRNRSLGGIHLTYEMKDEIPEFLEAADYPLLICENMDSGFPTGKITIPCQMAVGAANSEKMAYECGRITAIEAKAAGYNVVFGPTLDIAMNPKSSNVGYKSFGGNKELVARMGTAVIRGYQEQGMIVTGKHFPGFGESAVDSHLGMVYLEADDQTLISRELYPYIKAIKDADMSGVMLGHIMVPKIDPIYPASVSPKLIGLLRKLGFNGLVMTDSFAMIGMTNLFGLEECHGLAMAAGADMVMTSYRLTARKAYEYMVKAYERGMVTEEQIDAAAKRVLTAQAKTLLKPNMTFTTEKELEIAKRMSRESVTVVLSGTDNAAIPTDVRHLFILLEGNTFIDPQTGETQSETSGLENIEQLIKEKFLYSDIIKINEYPSREQMEYVSSITMEYKSIVMITYGQVQAYMGSSDLTHRVVALMNALKHKLSAVVLFGNPYASREFPEVPRIIYGYQDGFCEEAVMNVLSGCNTVTGKLPINLNFARGAK